MKKFTYLAATLLVMAGAVSCKKNAEVKEPAPQPTGVMRHVTVSAAGQGTAKTSVISGGTLIWSNDDHLSIVPTAGGFDAVALDIKDGAGTSSGTFEGDIDSGIKDDTQLYGWAGGNWAYDSGAFTVNMPTTQTYAGDGLAENAYPSIGTGSIESGISLSNPFGVLCLIVKGETTDAVKSITLTSAANNLAGEFTVNPNNSAVTEGSSKSITLNCTTAVALATDGVNFRIVVPAASYTDKDLTVIVTKSDDTSFNVTLGATTVAAGSTTKVEVKEAPAIRPACQSALNADANWVKIGDQYWLKENTKCIEYDTESEAYAAGIKTIKTISTSSSGIYTPYYTDPTTTTIPDYLDDQSDKLGLLYNWAAAVGLADGKSQTTPFTDNRQGICPNGSHIPSEAEWNILRDNLGGQSEAGKKMKTSAGWQSGIGEGDNGFAALPAGYASGSSASSVGGSAYYWLSDARNGTNAYIRGLNYTSDTLKESNSNKITAYSVRCLRNN
ncbi:MAG: hypothetical protein MJ010_01190 [Paludibacteraceae bacterium]|nr:hypothetical protein [Paludibacteraceae bacterium]